MADTSNITSLPPTSSTSAQAGARSPNPTHVSVGDRSGEMVNPQNTNGYPDPGQWPVPAYAEGAEPVRKNEAL